MRSGIIFCAVFLQPDPLITRRGFSELAIFGPEGDTVILVYIELFGVDGVGVAMLSSSDLKSVLQSACKLIKSAVGSPKLEEGQAMTRFEVAGWTANRHGPPPGF